MNLSHIAFNALDSKTESIFGKNPNKFMATCALGLSLASSLTFADNERERERVTHEISSWQALWILKNL